MKLEKHELEAEKKFKIKGLNILTTYDVYNMIVSALEGGSNYWYLIESESVKKLKSVTEDMNGEPFVDRLMVAIRRGVEVKVNDVENDEYLGTLNSSSWAKAEALLMKNHKKHLGYILLEEDDAVTADVFFQLAVIGKLTYG